MFGKRKRRPESSGATNDAVSATPGPHAGSPLDGTTFEGRARWANVLGELTISSPRRDREVSVATVLGPELRSLLESPGVAGLVPGTASWCLKEWRPDYVLVDENGFSEGPWTGALDSSGSGLLVELLDLVRLSAEPGPTFLRLPTVGVADSSGPFGLASPLERLRAAMPLEFSSAFRWRIPRELETLVAAVERARTHD